MGLGLKPNTISFPLPLQIKGEGVRGRNGIGPKSDSDRPPWLCSTSDHFEMCRAPLQLFLIGLIKREKREQLPQKKKSASQAALFWDEKESLSF